MKLNMVQIMQGKNALIEMWPFIGHFIGATNIANSTVEDDLFTSMLNSFNLHYNVPKHRCLSQEIDIVVPEMKNKPLQCEKAQLCADLWPKQGLTSSYLGITVHYFFLLDNMLRHAVLVLRCLPHPHTGLSAYLFYRCSFVVGEATNVYVTSRKR